MKKLIKEITEELLLVLKGKTIDTLLPPLIFVVSLNLFDLLAALIISLSATFVIWLYRFIKKEDIIYSLAGLTAVFIASFFAFLNNNASTFFIPDIIGSGLFVLITIYSLIIRKPFAAYVSHITRGWPLTWFFRDDVKKAYTEVTWFWLIYFVLRASIETYLYFFSTVEALVTFNTIVGYPLLIGVLVLSYIYGIWRLRNLKGPGVDEFIEQKEPPYRGQTRGF